jgi:hypothetical protein
MKVAIHQPQYLPWLGHFAKLAAADCWIFLDTVQYEKNGWQNRNRIKTPRGAQWLTVPVRVRLGTLIRDVIIDASQPWQRKHVEALRANYARAPYFERYFPDLERLLLRPWRLLTDLNVEVTRFLTDALGCPRRMLRASELPAARTDPTGRLLDLCLAVGADTYLAGADGARYTALEQFREGRVGVWRQEYRHPTYAQRHGDFLPFLSVVDLLLNQGESSLLIISQGDRWVPLVTIGP